jgi:antitoxin HicB
VSGVVTEGETSEEARRMAKDAIEGYLESLRQDGQPIPKDTTESRPAVGHDSDAHV